MIEVRHGVPRAQVRQAVLFPFDDHSVPFSAGLRLHLVPGKGPGITPPVVLDRGRPGDPDERVARFYGTVIPLGDRLCMWYLGGDAAGVLRACFATSPDGVEWEKPSLGLVAHGGGTANNLVDLLGGELPLAALPVLYDPDDPDPDRRFKAAFESSRYGNCLAVGFSPDGLR